MKEQKVKIKTWQEMEKEFGSIVHGSINCDQYFTKEMEELLPKNRIIEIDLENQWNTYTITEDMIKEYINEITKKPKEVQEKDIVRLKISKELVEEYSEELLKGFYALNLMPIKVVYNYVTTIFTYYCSTILTETQKENFNKIDESYHCSITESEENGNKTYKLVQR